MSQASIKAYWKPSFETLYSTYYQELASEALLMRWGRIDIVTAFLVTATASTSVIAGWALWDAPGWKLGWGIIAGIASIASIAHGVMRVPSRIKEQEELRRAFSELRVDLETFRQQLLIGLNIHEAKTKYEKLRDRLSQCVGRTHPDIAYTMGLRKAVQDQLNKKCKEKGYIP